MCGAQWITNHSSLISTSSCRNKTMGNIYSSTEGRNLIFNKWLAAEPLVPRVSGNFIEWTNVVLMET